MTALQEAPVCVWARRGVPVRGLGSVGFRSRRGLIAEDAGPGVPVSTLHHLWIQADAWADEAFRWLASGGWGV